MKVKFDVSDRREVAYVILYAAFAVMFVACAIDFGMRSMWPAATEYIILSVGNLISLFVTLRTHQRRKTSHVQ